MQPLNGRVCDNLQKCHNANYIYIIIVNYNCKITKCNQCDWGCVLLSLSQLAPHCCTLPLPGTLQTQRQTAGLPGSCSHRYVRTFCAALSLCCGALSLCCAALSLCCAVCLSVIVCTYVRTYCALYLYDNKFYQHTVRTRLLII